MWALHGQRRPTSQILRAHPALRRTVGLLSEDETSVAPEQLMGGRVDHRTDIYAVGVMLFRLVTGVLPPLSQAGWLAEFEKYKQIPQYKLVNAGMTLEAYKGIFWWEWAHRLLARSIGLIFALPLAWFWWRGALNAHLKPRLLALLVPEREGIGAPPRPELRLSRVGVADAAQKDVTADAPPPDSGPAPDVDTAICNASCAKAWAPRSSSWSTCTGSSPPRRRSS